jgi:hypothetical protein
MLPEITPEELADALDCTVAEVLATAGVDAPPVDPVALAHALGVLVAVDDHQAGRGRYVRLSRFGGLAQVESDELGHYGNSQASILVRSEPRYERQQWAIAHELGEHVAQSVFSRLDLDVQSAPQDSRERIANYLACRFLLPTDWFAADGQDCQWDLRALKRRYSTASHELIARRMLDFSIPAIITICDQGKITFRRSNLAGRVPPLVGLERKCMNLVHVSGSYCARREPPLLVRGWPVHEEGWKREILRCEQPEAE